MVSVKENQEMFAINSGRFRFDPENEERLKTQIKEQEVTENLVKNLLRNYETATGLASTTLHGSLVLKACASCGITELAPCIVPSYDAYKSKSLRWKECEHLEPIEKLKPIK